MILVIAPEGVPIGDLKAVLFQLPDHPVVHRARRTNKAARIIRESKIELVVAYGFSDDDGFLPEVVVRLGKKHRLPTVLHIAVDEFPVVGNCTALHAAVQAATRRMP